MPRLQRPLTAAVCLLVACTELAPGTDRAAGGPRPTPPAGDAGMDGGTDAGKPPDGAAGMQADTGGAGGSGAPGRSDDTGAPTGDDSGPEAGVDAGRCRGTWPDSFDPSDSDAGDEACLAPECRARPAPVDEPCHACACDWCAREELDCYFNADQGESERCAALVACSRREDCIGLDCYCGISFPCLFSPAGPCLRETEAAADSIDPITISERQFDTSTPLGRAHSLRSCLRSACPKSCPAGP